MWWLDYLNTGFTQTGNITALNLFRIVFAISCLIKFATETRRGYFRYFDEDKFLYGLYQVKKHSLFKITTFLYRALYILKIPAAFCLLLGVIPHISLIILGIAFLVEIQVYFKFHTNFFLLVGISLALSTDIGKSLTINHLLEGTVKSSMHLQGDLFSQFLIIITVTVMYISTVYRKCNPVFLSGAVVYTHLQQKLEKTQPRKHFDGLYPVALINNLVKQEETILTNRWQLLMKCTLILELMVPFFLWFETTRYVGIGLGIFMHILFTFIAPATLAHFSLITVGSYILFIDPHIIFQWLA